MTAKEIFFKTLQFGWIKLGLGLLNNIDSRAALRYLDGHIGPVQ